MKRPLGKLLMLGALTGAAVLTYQLLLSEEAKESLRAGAKSVKEACDKVCDVINGQEGTVMEDDMPSRQSTQRQWKSLGY